MQLGVPHGYGFWQQTFSPLHFHAGNMCTFLYLYFANFEPIPRPFKHKGKMSDTKTTGAL